MILSLLMIKFISLFGHSIFNKSKGQESKSKLIAMVILLDNNNYSIYSWFNGE